LPPFAAIGVSLAGAGEQEPPHEATTPMIRLSSVSRSFGPLKAVDSLSFAIERGETFGFLGPNGAGKSTCVAMMAGILRPDSGTVEIDGHGSPADPEVRRAVGVAPQARAFYEELSARENLDFFATLYGITGAKQRARVDYALEFVGLADRAKDRAGTFSGGMKRRLTLRTDRPFEAVARLAQSGATLEALRVTRATLEDVFLNLTGRRLRD
jgi:ABC-type multidrug transport system ATPase subunit